MRKQQAETLATNEMAAAGYTPGLAHATRDTGVKTWEVWGTDPDTKASVMIIFRDQWDQYLVDKAHASAIKRGQPLRRLRRYDRARATPGVIAPFRVAESLTIFSGYNKHYH